MLVGLTDQLEFVRVRMSEIKKRSYFRGWHCTLGRNVILLDQPSGLAKVSACGNIGSTCEQNLCWCGTDVEIIKAVNRRTLDYFISNVVINDSYRWCDDSDNLVAIGESSYVLDDVLHINWNISRRCNFNCTYCTPEVHDNHSILPTASECISYIDRYLDANRKICVSITGGEPTLIKNIIEVVDELHTSGVDSIRVLTNGSCTLDKLLDLHKKCSLIISVHHEYYTEKMHNKIIEFISRTLSTNEVTIKFYEECRLYEKLTSSDIPYKWLSVKMYPLIDKTNKIYTLKKI